MARSGLEERYGAPLVSRLLAGAATPGLQGRDYRRFRASWAREEGT